ncbi:unnamed protein product [Discosporangium mesarthrocarpum]
MGGAIGSLSPFLPLVWMSRGLSGPEVGIVGTVKSLVMIVLSPWMCSVIDRYNCHRQAFVALLALWGITRTFTLVVSGFWPVFGVEWLAATSFGALPSLWNMALMNLTNSGGDFGVMRSYGALSMGVVVLGSGLISDSGAGFDGVLLLFLFCTAVTMVTVVFTMPAGGRGSTSNAGVRMRKSVGSKGLWKGLKIAFANWNVTSLILAIYFSGIMMGVTATFLPIRLAELGGSDLCFGVARMVMDLSEIPFFFLSTPIIKSMGVRGVMILSHVAYVVRYTYYTQLVEPWWVMPAETLHGLTYALLWASAAYLAAELAKDAPHLKSTLQSITTAAYRGFGNGTGSLGGGLLFHLAGAQGAFAYSILVSVLAILILVLASGGGQASVQDEESGKAAPIMDEGNSKIVAPDDPLLSKAAKKSHGAV